MTRNFINKVGAGPSTLLSFCSNIYISVPDSESWTVDVNYNFYNSMAKKSETYRVL